MGISPIWRRLSRKIPKTLSGIETTVRVFSNWVSVAGKYLKPYQGLKLYRIWHNLILYKIRAGKYLKPYQGLKPNLTVAQDKPQLKIAGKYLKPYQGLKRHLV